MDLTFTNLKLHFCSFSPSWLETRHKQPPFYILCVFWGISLSRRTLGRCYAGGSSPNFVCSHIPMEIFLFYKMGKKWGNKNKRVVYLKERFPSYSWVLVRLLGNDLGCPSLTRTNLYKNLPYNKKKLCKSNWIFIWEVELDLGVVFFTY
jgi:hypothetical protein